MSWNVMRAAAVGTLVVAVLLVAGLSADDKKPDEKVKPIRALLITGGCCHDYTTQKLILSEGTAARAHIEWVVVQEGGSTTNTKIPYYGKDDWYKGFDIVVHNECFSDVKDPEWVDRILKPHREGLPAVVIHCAMHCYRIKDDEWFKFVGVTSHKHGAHYPFEVVNVEPKNPILVGFPEKWPTPKGELYQIVKLGENCKPLAHARSKETKKDETCIWTNQYGKARVFGTTVGHYNEEMADPVFLNYMTRGILWACDKLDDKYLKPFDPTKTKFRWEQPAKPKQTAEPPRADK
jgi:type 1 glutamine amidotransferase